MTLTIFLEKIKNNEPVNFEETMATIEENYSYQQTEFSNGIKPNQLINDAGTNEGSCKIFALAQINQLNQQQTLNLFGDYYRKDVLEDPSGNGHQNIRNFMRDSWEGIHFRQTALTAK